MMKTPFRSNFVLAVFFLNLAIYVAAAIYGAAAVRNGDHEVFVIVYAIVAYGWLLTGGMLTVYIINRVVQRSGIGPAMSGTLLAAAALPLTILPSYSVVTINVVQLWSQRFLGARSYSQFLVGIITNVVAFFIFGMFISVVNKRRSIRSSHVVVPVFGIVSIGVFVLQVYL